MPWTIVLLLGIILVVGLVLLSINDGKNMAKEHKPSRSIKSALLRQGVLLFAFALAIFFFGQPAGKIVSDKIIVVLFVGLLWVVLQEIPERLAHRHFKKKLEKIGVGGSTHN